MTRHDDLTRIRHMLDYAREAVEMLGGKRAEDVGESRVLQLALVRLVEHCGRGGYSG